MSEERDEFELDIPEDEDEELDEEVLDSEEPEDEFSEGFGGDDELE